MKSSLLRHLADTPGLVILVLLAGALIAAQADREAVEAMRSAAFGSAAVDGLPRIDAVAFAHPLSVD